MAQRCRVRLPAPSKIDRLLEDPSRLGAESQSGIQSSDGAQDVRQGRWIPFELCPGQVHPGVEYGTGGESIRAHDVGIGHLEEAGHEVRHALGPRLGLLCPVALQGCLPGLTHREDHGTSQEQHGPGSHGYPDTVAPHELPRSVADGVRPGDHREASQMTPQIVRQGRSRRVALLGGLAQCLEHDAVQVSRELPSQLLRSRAPSPGGVLGHEGARWGGIGVGHGPLDRRRREAGHLVRPPSTQQLAQEYPHLVHVRGRRDGLPPDLFRARIRRGQRSVDQAGGLPVPAGLQELRDPEVQQLHPSLGVHQDVGRFHVPVNHQSLMGRLEGAGDVEEELDPRPDSEPEDVAVLDDGRAVDVLHDEEGAPVLGGSAAQEAGHVGVVQGGEDLALGPEAFHHPVRVQAPVEDLHGDPLLPLPVVPLRQIDAGGAATAHPAKQSVGTGTGQRDPFRGLLP